MPTTSNKLVEYLTQHGIPRNAIRERPYSYNGNTYNRVEILYKNYVIQAFVLLSESYKDTHTEFPFYRKYNQLSPFGVIVRPACSIAVFSPHDNCWSFYDASDFKIKRGSDHINYKRAKDDFKERMGDDVYKKIVGWASILSIISFLYLIAHILSINNVIRGLTLPLDNSVISILLFIACMLLLIFVFPYAKSISFFNAIDIEKKDIR